MQTTGVERWSHHGELRASGEKLISLEGETGGVESEMSKVVSHAASRDLMKRLLSMHSPRTVALHIEVRLRISAYLLSPHVLVSPHSTSSLTRFPNGRLNTSDTSD